LGKDSSSGNIWLELSSVKISLCTNVPPNKTKTRKRQKQGNDREGWPYLLLKMVLPTPHIWCKETELIEAFPPPEVGAVAHLAEETVH